MVEAWHSFLGNVKLRRFTVLALLIAILFLIKSMLSMLLLTFVFTYLVVNFVRFVHKHTKIPSSILVIVTYIVIIWGLYIGIVNYLPQLVNQIIKMTDSLVQFYNHQNTTDFYKFVNKYVSVSSINEQVKKGVTLIFSYATSIGSMAFTFFLSLFSVSFTQSNSSNCIVSPRILKPAISPGSLVISNTSVANSSIRLGS